MRDPSTSRMAAARWAAAAGAFVVSLDSLVNIALPSMADTFVVPPEAVRWVVICYVLTYAVLSFVGGAAADVLGHRRVFILGLVIGVVGYLVCGTARNFAELLLGRVTQGVGAGLVYGTVPAIITLAAGPGGRGRAVGFFNGAVGLALAIGPVVAGGMVAGLGWRFVFHLRVPLALAVLVASVAALPRRRLQAPHPLVSIDEIRRARAFRPSALSFVANAGIFAIWLLAPFYLVATRGLTLVESGLIFMSTPLAMTIAAAIAGRMIERVGARRLAAIGMVMEAAGLFLLSRAGPATPRLLLAGALGLAGFGLGIFQVPNMALVMERFATMHQGAAGGLTFLTRTLGIVAGVFTLAQVFASRRVAVGLDGAFGDTFLAAAVLVGLAAAAALLPHARASS
jgi:MFS family permease